MSQVERQLTSALDARRLTSAGAAAGGFLGGPGGHGSPAPGTAGSTAKLAEILWQNLSKVLHQALLGVCPCKRRYVLGGIPYLTPYQFCVSCNKGFLMEMSLMRMHRSVNEGLRDAGA